MIRFGFHIVLCVSILFTSLSGSFSALTELVSQDFNAVDHSNGPDNGANDLPTPIAELEDIDDEEERGRQLLKAPLTTIKLFFFEDQRIKHIDFEYSVFHSPALRTHLLFCKFLI